MTLTINIPDAVATELVDNVCTATGWTSGSGKTKAAWAKEQVIRSLKQLAQNGAVRTAMAASKATLDGAGIS